jgi:hypothetical protein
MLESEAQLDHRVQLFCLFFFFFSSYILTQSLPAMARIDFAFSSYLHFLVVSASDHHLASFPRMSPRAEV